MSTMTRRCGSLFLLSLGLGLGFASDATGQTGVVSLHDTAAPPTVLQLPGPGVVRTSVRPQTKVGGVSVASKLPTLTTIRVSPFTGVTLDLVRKGTRTTKEGASVWQGAVKGAPKSSVFLIAKNNTVIGNIRSGSTVYKIRSRPDGSIVTQEVNTALLPQEAPNIMTRLQGARLDMCHPVANPNTMVDVFVAYTAAAETEAGGADAMAQEIVLSIEDTNAALEASGVNMRVNLVGQKKYTYTEADMGTNLTRLKSKTDGHLDDVHTQRDNTGADIAVLLTAGGAYCGWAGMIMDTPSAEAQVDAFAVVKLSCSSANHSFPHELGHLFGLHHDRVADNTGPANAHGHVDLGNRFRTVMAYNNQCSNAGFDCVRVQHFSNPSVNYEGHATGVAGASENASILRTNAPTVSAFRVSNVDNTFGWLSSCGIAKRRPFVFAKDCPTCVLSQAQVVPQVTPIWK